MKISTPITYGSCFCLLIYIPQFIKVWFSMEHNMETWLHVNFTLLSSFILDLETKVKFTTMANLISPDKCNHWRVSPWRWNMVTKLYPKLKKDCMTLTSNSWRWTHLANRTRYYLVWWYLKATLQLRFWKIALTRSLVATIWLGFPNLKNLNHWK